MLRNALFGLLAVALIGLVSIRAEDKAEPKKDEKAIDEDGFIKVWLLLAPIALDEGESQADAVDKEKVKDEAKLEPKAGDKTKAGDKELEWKKFTAEEHFFDFNKLLDEVKEQASGYAVTYIVADEEKKDVTLKIGSDDGYKIWLNAKEVGKGTEDRALEKDQDSFEKLTLKKGTNVLVFKVNNGIYEWTGCARFVDKDDKAIKGLSIELKK